MVAGKDELAGGTWLGAMPNGRFCAITNFRDPRDFRPPDPNESSRGHLVRAYLEGGEPPGAFLLRHVPFGPSYRGFNLLAGDVETLWWWSNRDDGPRPVEDGVHGLSNALLDTPWPKVVRGKEAVEAWLASGQEPTALFAALEDERGAPDDNLPDTGIGLDRERPLSAPFVKTVLYGTRCSTVLWWDRHGRATFVERTHAPERGGDVRIEL